jgi:hypothetical protein
MKIKLHEKVVGDDSTGNELKTFHVKTIEIVEQLLVEMLESVRSEIACKS